MPIGTVTRVFERRGFGYITPDEGDRDLFVQVDAATLAHFKPPPPESSPEDGVLRASSVSHATRASGDGRGLREGTRVRFEIHDSDVGLQAVAVAPLH